MKSITWPCGSAMFYHTFYETIYKYYFTLPFVYIFLTVNLGVSLSQSMWTTEPCFVPAPLRIIKLNFNINMSSQYNSYTVQKSY